GRAQGRTREERLRPLRSSLRAGRPRGHRHARVRAYLHGRAVPRRPVPAVPRVDTGDRARHEGAAAVRMTWKTFQPRGREGSFRAVKDALAAAELPLDLELDPLRERQLTAPVHGRRLAA